jgi:hypothetical protein
MNGIPDARQVPIEELPVEVMELYFMEAGADAGEQAAGPRAARGHLPVQARRRRVRSRSWRVSYL